MKIIKIGICIKDSENMQIYMMVVESRTVIEGHLVPPPTNTHQVNCCSTG